MKSIVIGLIALLLPLESQALGSCTITYNELDGFCLSKVDNKVMCCDHQGFYLPDSTLGRWVVVRTPIASPIAELLDRNIPVAAAGDIVGDDDNPCSPPFNLWDWLIEKDQRFWYRLDGQLIWTSAANHLATENVLMAGAKMLPY
jgi:hypothetical protein